MVLARALYTNPEVLILDEATNAIDSFTEKKILKNIKKEFKKITILFVTHRANTLSFTDKILFFKNGKIQSEGTYSKLVRENRDFNKLIKLAKNQA